LNKIINKVRVVLNLLLEVASVKKLLAQKKVKLISLVI